MSIASPVMTTAMPRFVDQMLEVLGDPLEWTRPGNRCPIIR